jgi:transposase InsO family protein
VWLEKPCGWRKRDLAEDDHSRLLLQHHLAGAYQAKGQIEEVVTLLEYVVSLKRRRYVGTHPSRVMSEEVLEDVLESMQLAGDRDSTFTSSLGIPLEYAS